MDPQLRRSRNQDIDFFETSQRTASAQKIGESEPEKLTFLLRYSEPGRALTFLCIPEPPGWYCERLLLLMPRMKKN